MARIRCIELPLTPGNYFLVQRIPVWYAPKCAEWLKAEHILRTDDTALGLLCADALHFVVVLVVQTSLGGFSERPLGWTYPIEQALLPGQEAELQTMIAAWAEEG